MRGFFRSYVIIGDNYLLCNPFLRFFCPISITAERPDHRSSQSSIRKSGNRSNSRVLLVISVSPSDLACPAIIVSFSPIRTIYPVKENSRFSFRKAAVRALRGRKAVVGVTVPSGSSPSSLHIPFHSDISPRGSSQTRRPTRTRPYTSGPGGSAGGSRCRRRRRS